MASHVEVTMLGKNGEITGVSYQNKSFINDENRTSEGISDTGKIEPNITNEIVDCSSTIATKEGDLEHQNIKDIESKTPKTISAEAEEDVVPDGGWGWLVAAGGFIGQMVINVSVSCFGILYSEFLLDLNTPAVVSSWIFNLMGFTMTLSGIFVRGLVTEFGFRKTTFMASLLCAVGCGSTAFATSPYFLMISFSFLSGIGNGIMANITYTAVPFYFKKRLGIANAIMSSGVSAGQIIGPPFITYLQSKYGYQGTTLITGAFALHGCITAIVLHPREWHMKRPRAVPKDTKRSTGILKVLFRILKSTLTNFKLIKSPVAVIVAFGGALNAIGYLNFLTILPFSMQEAGFTVQDAATLLTVSGLSNLFIRLIVSVLTDYKWFNMRIAYMTGTLIAVVLSIVYCFLTDLTAITITIGVWGCGIGIYMGLFNLVMVRFVGLERLMTQLGLTGYIASLWFLACGPIVGSIRDATGSYTYSVFTLAGTIFITYILYLFLPWALAYEQKKKDKNND